MYIVLECILLYYIKYNTYISPRFRDTLTNFIIINYKTIFYIINTPPRYFSSIILSNHL